MARLFGTDGVRGIANEELTPMLAMQLGQAGAYVLTREKEHKPTIMVGCDTRISGDMLANALMAGACSVGANCVYVGVLPTPAVAYLTQKYKVDAGVVISASHNPVEFNGIKFFDGNGYKLPDELEDEIEGLIKDGMPGIKFPTGTAVGKVKYRTDAREEYINHAIQAVPVDLSGMKIVVDCAEGASFYTSVEALKELGGSVVAIHNNPDGANINANCGSTHMEELQARVVFEKANLGLAFDGDADRLLAVDENGNVVDGDQIMAIVGNHCGHGHEQSGFLPHGGETGDDHRTDQGGRPLCAGADEGDWGKPGGRTVGAYYLPGREYHWGRAAQRTASAGGDGRHREIALGAGGYYGGAAPGPGERQGGKPQKREIHGVSCDRRGHQGD